MSVPQGVTGETTPVAAGFPERPADASGSATAPSAQGTPAESATVIRDRAVSLADYLLAVRAQMDRPARTVPTKDAHWLHTLPDHPDCQLGPGTDGTSWLRVGLPDPVPPIAVPPDLRRRLNGEVTATSLPEPAVTRPARAASAPAQPDSRGAETGAAQTGGAETGGADDGRATEDERTRRLFEQWRDEQWRPWATAVAETEKTRRLHRELFDLMHRLDMDATTELVWGHGILHTRIGGHPVRYPLVATAVIIEYDPDRSVITVSPQGPPRLQTDPLGGLDDRYLSQLLALAGPAGTVEVDLWNAVDRRELFERALGRLGYHRTVRPAPGAAEPTTAEGAAESGADGAVSGYVVDTGVLFTRPKQRLLRGFLESLRERLLAGDTRSIGALAAILAHEPSRLRMPDDQPDDWRRVGERLLMPLPTNPAQESIARRLAQHRNVAVQGPPGTGKTHTIRNLICHLMANGKRVLVVAQKEDPLRVLRDGLPEEVRSLCLAVLGRTADQLVQLQLAARDLSDRAATLDRVAEATRVQRLTGALEEAERDLGRALAGLRAVAEDEATSYDIDGVAMSPAEVGAWLRARAGVDGGIPDEVTPDVEPPLTADGFAALLDLARRVSAAQRQAAVRHLPLVADLPDAATALKDRARLAAATADLARLAGAGVDIAAVRALGRLGTAELLADLREAVGWLHRRAGTWVDRLGRLVADPHWRVLWDDHVAASHALLADLAVLARTLAGHRVVVAADLADEPKRLLGQLTELRQRFAAGRGLSRLLQPALHRVAEQCRVDGEPLRTAEDVDVAAAWVRRAQARQRLGAHWADWAPRLDAPAGPGSPEMWVGSVLAEAAQSLEWDRQEWPSLSARLRSLVPQQQPALDAGWLAAVSAVLERCPVVFDHDDLRAADEAVAADLWRGGSTPGAAEVWRRLDTAWRQPGLDRWDEELAEVSRLAALRPDVHRYLELRDRLAAVAPRWTALIDAGEVPAMTGSACLDAWRWRRAQTWFDRVVGAVDPAVLSRRVEQARDRIRRHTADLVVASAWLEVSHSLDDRRRAALADWTTALRKIGKGTGRNAAAWQAHAQRAMASAVEAVPVWVMSVDRAIEQFAGGAHFDVVIVDEASQADLFGLPVLSLAERAVVVGDDQQIGPQLGFVGTVTGLINGHLGDVPSAEHFDPDGSLYDHAVRRSPERILLTEHFRCVPQIIEFSSRHYYDGRIEPLRPDRSSALGDPVRTVHLPDGVRQVLPDFGDVNLAEADALVERVAAIVADPAYAGHTLGVISLLSSSGQALYLLARLREVIGEEEIQSRRLRVGDAYTFQGDERDVVLVSMVVSANGGRVAAFTKREYHRRINVAASRARDQLWIFHSVQPADLLPDDARALLLTYAQNVSVAEETYDDLEGRCDSDFERAVLRRLLARGHRPIPQFRLGGYRIDFVLTAPDGRRLAIECDGDAYHGPEQWESDMRRQSVLERVGNCVFVRVRGSVFAREPDAALRPLWQRMDELGMNG